MSGTAPQKILTNPELYANQYRVLSGLSNSTGSESDTIDVTNNDREFSSRGLQISTTTAYSFSNVDNELSFGIGRGSASRSSGLGTRTITVDSPRYYPRRPSASLPWSFEPEPKRRKLAPRPRPGPRVPADCRYAGIPQGSGPGPWHVPPGGRPRTCRY